jgi:chemotaxis signal transduction protein
MGLAIDRMNKVSDIPDSQIEPPPRSSNKRGQYVQGMGMGMGKMSWML